MPTTRRLMLAVAEALRHEITTGLWAPGDWLPAERELAARFGAARETVRDALAMLDGEGRVTRIARRGTQVNAATPVRRLTPHRYFAEADPTAAPATSFTTDQAVAWEDYRLDRVFLRVRASESAAAAFGVPVGEELLERHFVFHSSGVVEQIAVSSYPWRLVEGTPIADPSNEPWPGGNHAQLLSIGVRLTYVEETITARLPVGEEASVLGMSPARPVLTIGRRSFAGARVVEVAEIVMPAARVQAVVGVDLTRPPPAPAPAAQD